MSQPWQSHSWRRFPLLTATFLIGASAAMGLSFLVLRLADGQPTESWMVTPNIILSIIATLASIMLRAAFRSGADLFWWSRLVSESGATLRELHGLWDLGQGASALLKGPEPLVTMRSAGLCVLLLAINGPLLQKAITVELAVRPSERTATLPIRIEPMWNETVLEENGSNGWSWTIPAYQPEFAKLSSELGQRKLPQLSSPGCGENSNCTAEVTVAGFSRDCRFETAPFQGVQSLGDAKMVVLYPLEAGWDGRVSSHGCWTTGSMEKLNTSLGASDMYCAQFQTYYQLAVDVWYPDSGGERGEVTSLNYTSYLRLDKLQDTLTIQRCAFTPAFVRVPVQITNGSVVSLVREGGTASSRQNRVIETILSPFPSKKNIALLGGFVQVMKDMFQGYILFDINEGAPVIRGTGPRQYINSTTFARNGKGGFAYDIIDPLDDFTAALDDLCLRYAITRVPTDRPSNAIIDRTQIPEAQKADEDRWAATLGAIKTPLAPDQTVTLSERATLAVYRVRYAYAVAPLVVTLAASLSVSMLLAGWRRLGRAVSLSPLEMAKAFDAPLLRAVGSNSTNDELARDLRSAPRVRYGEVPAGESLLSESDHRREVKWASDGGDSEGSRRVGDARLVIDVADRVATPREGEMYR